MNKKYKQKTINVLKAFVLLALLTGISGCSELSKILDPKKNALTKKVVTRDKPNLSETEAKELDVDPDSDDLVEETEDESNSVVDNSNTGLTANANTSETNTSESDPNTGNAAQKAQSLVGKWQGTIDGNNAIFEFGASRQEGDRYVGKLTVYAEEAQDDPILSTNYSVLNDNSVEIVQNGKSAKVGADVSADGKTMRFTGADGKVVNLTRVNGKTPQNQKQNNPGGRAIPPPLPDGQD